MLTKEHLLILQLNASVEALNTVVAILFAALGHVSPATAQSLRTILAHRAAQHQTLVLKDSDPSYSDMVTAEYQEALRSLIERIDVEMPH